MVKSDYTPTSALNLKKLVLRFNYKEVLGKVELLDSKGNLLITLTEPEETYDDCFLTKPVWNIWVNLMIAPN